MMNIIYKLGYKKYYMGSYLLSFVAIVFYLSLYFSEKLYGFLEIKTSYIFREMPFLDLRLSLYVLAFMIIAITSNTFYCDFNKVSATGIVLLFFVLFICALSETVKTLIGELLMMYVNAIKILIRKLRLRR